MNKRMELLLANKQVQLEVCGYLASAGYIEPATKFSDVKLTLKGKAISKNDMEVNETFLINLRKLWPDDRCSTPAPIRQNYIRYKQEFPDHTDQEIYEGAKIYFEMENPKYICHTHNYFVSNRNEVKVFKAAQYVEVYRKNVVNKVVKNDDAL